MGTCAASGFSAAVLASTALTGSRPPSFCEVRQPQPKRDQHYTSLSKQQGTSLAVYLTGFGPFGSVIDNPTSIICRRLHSRKDALLAEGVEICCLDVLEVSAEAAKERAQKVRSWLSEQAGPACVIHLGVAYGSPRLRLECRALNKANFTIPDAKGWIADNAPVVPGAGPCAFTSLSITELFCELKDLGVDCEISHHPGTYICNYIYFSSLHQASEYGPPVLFVHTPNFETMSEDKQAAAMEEILKALQRLAANGRLQQTTVTVYPKATNCTEPTTRSALYGG